MPCVGSGKAYLEASNKLLPHIVVDVLALEAVPRCEDREEQLHEDAGEGFCGELCLHALFDEDVLCGVVCVVLLPQTKHTVICEPTPLRPPVYVSRSGLQNACTMTSAASQSPSTSSASAMDVSTLLKRKRINE